MVDYIGLDVSLKKTSICVVNQAVVMPADLPRTFAWPEWSKFHPVLRRTALGTEVSFRALPLAGG